MYYVAKVYSAILPNIVESFEDEVLAFNYAEIMNKAGKGTYIVLKLTDCAPVITK